MVLLTLYVSAFYLPMSMDTYSAAPAAMSADAEQVYLQGTVTHDDGTPAAYHLVDLFATDELILAHPYTDADGVFYSAGRFRCGQLIRVTIFEEDAFGDYSSVLITTRFIPWDVDDINHTYDLGTFIIPRPESLAISTSDGKSGPTKEDDPAP